MTTTENSHAAIDQAALEEDFQFATSNFSSLPKDPKPAFDPDTLARLDVFLQAVGIFASLNLAYDKEEVLRQLLIPSSEFREGRSVHETTEEKVSGHSHSKELGLDDNGVAIQLAASLADQTCARENAGMIVDSIKEKKMAGSGALLDGSPGTAKKPKKLAP